MSHQVTTNTTVTTTSTIRSIPEVFATDLLPVALNKQSKLKKTKKDLPILVEFHQLLLINRLTQSIERTILKKRSRTNILNPKKSMDETEPGKKKAKKETMREEEREKEEEAMDKIIEWLADLKMD